MAVILSFHWAKKAPLFISICIISIVVEVDAENDSLNSPESTASMSREEKSRLRDKSLEMFDHAYGAYMAYAYPADELMPLSCKGRFRGSEPSRGDVDDTLGNFTLTLIDTLDTLAVLGKLDEFEEAVRNVIQDTRFDTDVVVSVFETNIRILGGLLGGHVAAVYFKKRRMAMNWYQGELLTMAKEVGDRLLPAFNTTTGIPYARVNLRHGITPKIKSSNRDTCTSCAGTMILEFAALSRLTGIPVYEEKSRHAMDYLWGQRHRSNNLMGTVLNVHNGDWVRRESGVGAGIDSYYEYVLKAYVLLGDNTYLTRFQKHYDGVMRYISQGPLLVDVHMHKPTSAARNFMDALLAFWPGLQVLLGDIGPAVETHEMLYQVVKRHNFLPEAFTTDFRIHWGQHPLRPEFVESTYFLYKATGDPYYLGVGRKVLENLEQHARVPCGFAAIKDIKRGTHEDQMDSFVLAETFKYLYLLFSENSELALDVEDFVFTTEAHLLPLTLSLGNYTFSATDTDAADRPKSADLYRFDKMSVAEMTQAVETEDIDGDYNSLSGGAGVCRNYHASVSEGPGYPHRLRHRLRDMVERAHPESAPLPRLRAAQFVAANKEHLDQLRLMGIRLATMADGRIQLLHSANEAVSPAHARAGLEFMQEMLELSQQEQQMQQQQQHTPMIVKVKDTNVLFRGGPAQFGYDLSAKPPVSGELAIASPIKACTPIDNARAVQGRIALVERGDCMFVEKARNLQKVGALGGIVMDQAAGSSSDTLSLFAMSGDGTNDVDIPMVFLFWQQGQDLLSMLSDSPGLEVELSASKEPEGLQKECRSEKPSSVVTPAQVSPAPVKSAAPEQASSPSLSLSLDTEEENIDTEADLPEGPAMRPSSVPHSSTGSFYHQDFHDVATKQYFLQAGTRTLHLSVEVSAKLPHHSNDRDYSRIRLEPLPDGSKMLSFQLKHSPRYSAEGQLEKPSLTDMYQDIASVLQRHTNLEDLQRESDFLQALARCLEAAYFNMDQLDRQALDVLGDFVLQIKAKGGDEGTSIVWAESRDSPSDAQHKLPEDGEANIPASSYDEDSIFTSQSSSSSSLPPSSPTTVSTEERNTFSSSSSSFTKTFQEPDENAEQHPSKDEL